MDANPQAGGGVPDDDVFGPVEDGEEVFEWVDEDDDADGQFGNGGFGDGPDRGGGARAAGAPAPSLRERVAALRAAGAALRRSQRKIAAVVASVVLAGAVGAACTAWFDSAAGAADRGAVVALAVDSVVNGDPAATEYDSAHFAATTDYVIEVANNGPAAVTLTSVGFNAGTLMSSTGWKPAGGSGRIPGGGTADVVVTARLFCPMVALGAQTGGFGVSGRGPGGSALPFPALSVKAVDGNGVERDLMLPTRVSVSSLLRGQSGELTFVGSGAEPTPQVVTADAGACAPWEAEREQQLRAREKADAADTSEVPADPTQRSGGLLFTYDKVLSHAGNAFVLGVNVQNTTEHSLTLATRSDAGYLQNPALQTQWVPTAQDIGPGETRQVRLAVTVRDCGAVQARVGGQGDVTTLAETLLEVVDPVSGANLPIYPDQLMKRALRLARDADQQIKAACA